MCNDVTKQTFYQNNGRRRNSSNAVAGWNSRLTKMVPVTLMKSNHKYKIYMKSNHEALYNPPTPYH